MLNLCSVSYLYPNYTGIHYLNLIEFSSGLSLDLFPGTKNFVAEVAGHVAVQYGTGTGTYEKKYGI